jgi:hypothetical protein
LTQFIIIPALVLALGISLMLVARSVWRVAFGAEPSGWMHSIFTILLVGSASCITIDWIQVARTMTSRSVGLYSDFGCFAAISALTLYGYLVFAKTGSAASLRRNSHSWVMLLIATMMVGWCYHRIGVRCMDASLVGFENVLPGTVDVDQRAFAVTDKGEMLSLYRLSTTEEVFEEYMLGAEDKFKSFNHVGIHREDADQHSNCHGWVFTAGRFLVKGRDVDRILCDNGYFAVTVPKPDDIVIYRDEDGLILHTALVQGVLRDGTVIAESKWGVDERFLHLPEDQPYSQIYEYYRTERPSHLLRILDSKDLETFENYIGLLDG